MPREGFPHMVSSSASSPRLSRPHPSAEDLLASYAGSHRDRRNIQTHLIGIPLTLLALGILLGRPNWSFGAVSVSPAWLCFAVAAAWYLTRRNLRLGLAVCAGLGLTLLASERVLSLGLGSDWTLGIALLGLGMLLQAVGHYYEGRRPASLENPVYLLVGPMFVTVEMLSSIGFLRPLAAEVRRRAGPVHVRDLADPAATR